MKTKEEIKEIKSIGKKLGVTITISNQSYNHSEELPKKIEEANLLLTNTKIELS